MRGRIFFLDYSGKKKNQIYFSKYLTPKSFDIKTADEVAGMCEAQSNLFGVFK